MNHAQFRELLFRLHGEFCEKQIKFKGVSDFLDGNYNGKKELLWCLLCEFDLLTDVAAEVEIIEKYIEEQIVYHRNQNHLISTVALKKVLKKLKELSK